MEQNTASQKGEEEEDVTTGSIVGINVKDEDEELVLPFFPVSKPK